MRKRSLFLIVAGVILVGCTREMVVEEYSDLRAAMTPGAAGSRGWIPGFTPTSAFNLRIAYNIETNEVWLMYEADSQELTNMLVTCPVRKDQRMGVPRRPPRISWWPESLTSVSSKANVDWRFFSCDPQGAGAVDLSNLKAYYWRH